MIYNGFTGGQALQSLLCEKRREELLAAETRSCCRSHKALFFHCHAEDLYEEVTCTCGSSILSYPYTYAGIWEEIFGGAE